MKTENQALQQVVQAMTAKVKPQMRKPFDRIVLAGMKLMYSDQMEKMLRQQIDSGPPAQAAGQGAAKLLGLLMSKANGTAPYQALVPAGIVLLCEALDFMEKAGKVEVTPELVAEATQEFSSALLQMLGVTKDKLAQMMAGAKPQEQQQAPQPEQPGQQAQPGQPQQPQAPQPGALIGARP